MMTCLKPKLSCIKFIKHIYSEYIGLKQFSTFATGLRYIFITNFHKALQHKKSYEHINPLYDYKSSMI